MNYWELLSTDDTDQALIFLVNTMEPSPLGKFEQVQQPGKWSPSPRILEAPQLHPGLVLRRVLSTFSGPRRFTRKPPDGRLYGRKPHPMSECHGMKEESGRRRWRSRMRQGEGEEPGEELTWASAAVQGRMPLVFAARPRHFVISSDGKCIRTSVQVSLSVKSLYRWKTLINCKCTLRLEPFHCWWWSPRTDANWHNHVIHMSHHSIIRNICRLVGLWLLICE